MSEAAQARVPGVELVIRLRIAHAAVVDLDRVPQVLGDAHAPWLGESAPSGQPGIRSFLCDLELQSGGMGPTLFRKAAVVSFGEPERRGDGWVVPIEWRAASMTALFPVYAGHLVIKSDQLRLDGRYAPPGGRLGYLLDVALLGTAARQTGHWFMRRLATALA